MKFFALIWRLYLLNQMLNYFFLFKYMAASNLNALKGFYFLKKTKMPLFEKSNSKNAIFSKSAQNLRTLATMPCLVPFSDSRPLFTTDLSVKVCDSVIFCCLCNF